MGGAQGILPFLIMPLLERVARQRAPPFRHFPPFFSQPTIMTGWICNRGLPSKSLRYPVVTQRVLRTEENSVTQILR